MATLLLIDDDPELAEVTALAFTRAGHRVEVLHSGSTAEHSDLLPQADVIVCDVNLPGVDGFTLTKRWRARGVKQPILLLTSRDSEIDEALGLELGADDYVTKPVSMRILLLRVDAMLRRQRTPSSSDDSIVVGNIQLNRARCEVQFKNQPIACTLSEFRLLEALLERPGVVFTRTQLLVRVRGDDSIVDDRLIDTYVRRLRRKLEEIETTFAEIETVPGLGYRWRDR